MRRTLITTRWVFVAAAIGAVMTACGASDRGAGDSESSAATAGDSGSMAGDGSLTAGSGGSEAAGRGGSGGKAGSESAGGAGVGGSAGSISSGGSGAAAGAAGSSGAGGAAGAGAAGASGTSASEGCRSNLDCPNVNTIPGSVSMTTCISPDKSPPGPAIVCGAPSWCGRCDCPPQPIPLEGNGMMCMASDDCPTGDAEARAASVCFDGACRECGADEDCPAELPACVQVGGVGLAPTSTCVECFSDTHCPTEKPHCVGTGGIGGECWPCASTADCEVGICGASGCVAACSEDSQCTNPLTHCTNQRCESIVCTDSSVCPVNAECRDGVCQRGPCELDADCADGVCVNAVCYEMLGYCFTQSFAP